MTRAEVLAGRGFRWWTADVHLGGEGGWKVGLSNAGESLGDRGVGGKDHGLAGHHAAGRELVVCHQTANTFRLSRLHLLEKKFRLIGG